MMDLVGQVAIITGAGRGIGRAIALTFARVGADVVLVSRTGTELETVAAEVRQLGRQALPLVADVSVEDDVEQVVVQVIDTFKRVDILVNNAGIDAPTPFVDTTPEEWTRVMGINFVGVLHFSRSVLPHMVKQRSGKIINISSGAGTRGHPNSAIYAASKAAVNAFSQSLADEVKGNGVQVNVISPGPIRTQMTADPSYQSDRPRPAHLLEPDEVANAALYLASDLSGRVNAQIMYVRESNRW